MAASGEAFGDDYPGTKTNQPEKPHGHVHAWPEGAVKPGTPRIWVSDPDPRAPRRDANAPRDT